MKHLREIVRELCWNSGIHQTYDYLVNDRNLNISKSEIEQIENLIGDFVSMAYYPSPYENSFINMNDFVDEVEEMVWDKYQTELDLLS